MVNLPLQANHASPRLSVASESRVPVLQCRISRLLLSRLGPIYYAPPLNSMAKGIAGCVSRIVRSVLSAAWKHRMRVSERHNSPAATASRSAGSIQIESDFQVTRSTNKLQQFLDLGFRRAVSPACQVTRSNGAPDEGLSGSLPLAFLF